MMLMRNSREKSYFNHFINEMQNISKHLQIYFHLISLTSNFFNILYLKKKIITYELIYSQKKISKLQNVNISNTCII